jgi:hypothetical protein
MISKAKSKQLLLAAQQQNKQERYPASKLISIVDGLFLYRQLYYYYYYYHHHHLELRHFNTIQERAL